MAPRREELRAADVDRQFVAERLKGALDEGRLALSEYDERLGHAYGAKTYGDLDRVLADLPGFTPSAQQQVLPTPPTYPTAQPAVRRMPGWVVGIWGAWAVAVSVNVVIWLLVSVSNGEPVYFWPMWVAGPWGAVLLVGTFTRMLAGDAGRERDRRRHR